MDHYRKEIDKIDDRIAELLGQRLNVAFEIGRYKQARGLSIIDEEREREIIKSFTDHFEESRKKYAEGVIRAIIEAGRAYQSDSRLEYALLGSTLGHSLSPRVHRALGGYECGLIELDEEELDNFFSAFPLKGASVTMPYKRIVMKYLDQISETAEAAGSVNTIVKRSDGKLAGYNTDYDGFKYTVEKSGINIGNRKCLIFGSGGVSGTVKSVLEDCGAGEVRIISRSDPDSYENLNDHIDAHILVNATPLGMFPDIEMSPVDPGRFPECCGVFDLIYNPLRSRFVMEAEDNGIPAFSGLDMLVAQAACACMLFTGEDNRDRIEEVCEAVRREQENIVLIGMPGSGKTSIGEKLAELTGKDFVDTDQRIHEKYGRTAEDSILTEGLDTFRRMETETIADISKHGGQIIATGGGVIERRENKNLLRSNGRIVYIKRNLDELPTAGRPVSMTDGVDRIYATRKSAYESWQDITVENRGIEETAREIKKKLER